MRQADSITVAVVGESRDGQWTPLDHVQLDSQRPSLDIDPDRATCLILVCEPGAQARWAEHLTRAVQQPDLIVGY